MARYTEERYGYFELKADLSPRDAAMLQRLIRRPAAAPDVVSDLVINEEMSQSDAYFRVRSLLLNCMDKLNRAAR